MEEFWDEMRRREREEEEGEARPQKSKMWRVRGKQRAGGTGAATFPLHPLSIPSPLLPNIHPPPPSMHSHNDAGNGQRCV